MRLLRISGLTKIYDEGEQARTVFADLELTLCQGEVVALLGRSGSGKSTLLNLISGIDRPDKGIIEVAGQPLTVMNETQVTYWRRRHIGMVFQFFNLIPTLTVIENVLLPLQLNRLAGDQQQRASELLGAVGLGERWNSFPERLSGGEQQRLAIARALIHRPSLLLADEPTGNLDSDTSSRVVALLLTLLRQHATTALLVTHSEAVAASADRLLYLEQGQLREQSC